MIKVVSLCLCLQKAERDPEEMRREMELQLEAWHKLAPGAQEEVRLRQEVLFKVSISTLNCENS